jgi:hypothetical protein
LALRQSEQVEIDLLRRPKSSGVTQEELAKFMLRIQVYLEKPLLEGLTGGEGNQRGIVEEVGS